MTPPPPYQRRRKSTPRLLFGADFTQHITLRLLKAGYRIVIVADGFAVLMWIWIAYGLQHVRWIGWAIPATIYIAAPILGILVLGFVRVWCEYLTVAFGIAERVQDLDRKVGYLAGRAYAAERAATGPTRPDPDPHEQ